MSGQGDDFAYARALEGAAQGLSVHETMAALIDQGVSIPEAAVAACDVARDLTASGIEDDDLDESWIRLRYYTARLDEHLAANRG